MDNSIASSMDLNLPDYLCNFILSNQQEQHRNFQGEIFDNGDLQLKKCILSCKAVPSVPHNNRFWISKQEHLSKSPVLQGMNM